MPSAFRRDRRPMCPATARRWPRSRFFLLPLGQRCPSASEPDDHDLPAGLVSRLRCVSRSRESNRPRVGSGDYSGNRGVRSSGGGRDAVGRRDGGGGLRDRGGGSIGQSMLSVGRDGDFSLAGRCRGEGGFITRDV